MSASDYGYAADSSYHSTILSGYNTKTITLSNWLYSQGAERTSFGYIIYYDGSVSGSSEPWPVRPVVYLDSSVYIIDGDGSITNPYQIGM